MTYQAAAPTLMVARLSLASEDRMERNIITNITPLQAELDTNPEEDPVVITNEITESLTGHGDNVVWNQGWYR